MNPYKEIPDVISKRLKWYGMSYVVELWHPASPGIRFQVRRSWLAMKVKSAHFATLSETLKSFTCDHSDIRVEWTDGFEAVEICNICGKEVF